MAVSELCRPIEAGKFDDFDNMCLEMIEARQIRVAEVVAAIDLLAKKGQAKRVESLGPMLLDALNAASDAAGALALCRSLLSALPDNAAFRAAAVKAYAAAYADEPAVDAILKASGLDAGRPARIALKTLDVCLGLRPGSFLVERTDETPYEVVATDPQGLFTLRGAKRTITIAAAEVASRYEAVRPDDIRVLRRLQPQKLAEMAETDPVALLVSLLHAHGDAIDLEVLKDDIVPAAVSEAKWSEWWNKAKTKLKRNPNVVIEGRSPVFLKYTHQAVSLEDETWDAFAAQQDPVKWQATVEGYLREKKRSKEEPDAALLGRISARMVEYVASVREKRPGDAFACGLVVHALLKQGVPSDATLAGLASEILKHAKVPASFIRGLPHPSLWDVAINVLPAARPDDWAVILGSLLPSAPESVVDDMVAALSNAGMAGEVQKHIDATMADPLASPEMLSWLWKGPKSSAGLTIPPQRELLSKVLGTLSVLGRSVTPTIEVMKNFRAKMKNALAHRDYARFRSCMEQIEEGMAVTLRRQIERLEGLGDNAPVEMVRILRETHPQLWARKRVERWQDADVIWTTNEGLQKKKAELDDIVNVKMRENAKAIGRAAEYGDLSENSEYKFALEERDLLRARLAKLNDEMSRAQTFGPDEVPTDQVGIGSGVTLRDPSTGAARKIRFLGPWDAAVEQAIFNYQAPIGQKLMGAKPGDRVVLTMDGADQTFEVKEIWNGLTA